MAVLIRTWLGISMLGAALVHLGVAATAPPALLVILTLLGLAELAWAFATLAGSAVPLPRAALVIALLPPLTWTAVAVTATVTHGAHHASPPLQHASSGMSVLPGLPMLLASMLDLVPAAVIAARLRRGGPQSTRAEVVPKALPYLLGVALGGGAVAGVTSTALGATQVGALAMRGMGH